MAALKREEERVFYTLKSGLGSTHGSELNVWYIGVLWLADICSRLSIKQKLIEDSRTRRYRIGSNYARICLEGSVGEYFLMQRETLAS